MFKEVCVCWFGTDILCSKVRNADVFLQTHGFISELELREKTPYLQKTIWLLLNIEMLLTLIQICFRWLITGSL